MTSLPYFVSAAATSAGEVSRLRRSRMRPASRSASASEPEGMRASHHAWRASLASVETNHSEQSLFDAPSNRTSLTSVSELIVKPDFDHEVSDAEITRATVSCSTSSRRVRRRVVFSSILTRPVFLSLRTPVPRCRKERILLSAARPALSSSSDVEFDPRLAVTKPTDLGLIRHRRLTLLLLARQRIEERVRARTVFSVRLELASVASADVPSDTASDSTSTANALSVPSSPRSMSIRSTDDFEDILLEDRRGEAIDVEKGADNEAAVVASVKEETPKQTTHGESMRYMREKGCLGLIRSAVRRMFGASQ